jgi:hypothetical protein
MNDKKACVNFIKHLSLFTFWQQNSRKLALSFNLIESNEIFSIRCLIIFLVLSLQAFHPALEYVAFPKL